MLWVFTSAGLTGLLCAGLFAAPAIVALSILTFAGIGLAAVLAGQALGDAFLTAFLTSGALQIGFLLGVCLQQFWRQITARAAGLEYGKLLSPPLNKPSLTTADRRDKIRNLAR